MQAQVHVDLRLKEDRDGRPYFVGTIEPGELPFNALDLSNGIVIMIWADPNNKDTYPEMIIKTANYVPRHKRNQGAEEAERPAQSHDESPVDQD